MSSGASLFYGILVGRNQHEFSMPKGSAEKLRKIGLEIFMPYDVSYVYLAVSESMRRTDINDLPIGKRLIPYEEWDFAISRGKGIAGICGGGDPQYHLIAHST